MQKTIYTLITLTLLACGTATDEPIVEAIIEEEVDSQEILPEPIEEFVEDLDGLIYTDFDGIVIRKTSTYTNPTTEEEPNGYLRGTTFVMQQKGERMSSMHSDTDDECRLYGYHWYLVSEGADAPSWISGEDLFLRSKSDFADIQNNNEIDFGYMVDGKSYRFDVAATSFEEPDNVNEPIYCYTYGFPFMYQDDQPTVFPIIVTKEVGELGFIFDSTADGYLLILLNSDGGGGDIDDFIEIETGIYQIKLTIGYQDGSENAILHVMEKDGQFLLTKIERSGVSY